MATPALQPSRILVADDEHLMALAIAEGLKSLGYTVVGPAADGQQAIELAEAEPADLALLDISMPAVDGLQAACTLWERFALPSIIITAFGRDDYVERASRAGVFGYLLKPITPDDLCAAIRIAWSRATDRAALAERIVKLERSLEDRRTVEQAKWRMVSELGLDEPSAHTRLQQIARSRRQRIAEIAREVLAAPSLESVGR